MSKQFSGKRLYELENIMERWAQSMMNKYGEYKTTDEDTDFNRKAISEIVEKHLMNNINQATRFFMEQCIRPLNLSLEIPIKTVRGKCMITADTISYKDFKMSVDPQTIATMKGLTSNDNIIRMALRYASILPKGQNWSIPRAQYNYLYKRGIRYEAFASPFNSKLMGKEGAKFCSIFPDTDKPFGSIGNFFDMKIGQSTELDGWVVNPPFIDEILIKSANKIVEVSHEIFVFFIMPNWTDSEAYRILSEHKNTVFKKTLEKNTYFYENNGEKIIAKFASVVFIVYSGLKPIDFSDICDNMMI